MRRAARQVVELMQSLDMNPFVMTTGSRGLHVVAPLRADADFDSVRALARDMAAVLAERHRATLTVEQRKNKRRGRVYLDVMRNAYGQTSVIPYSVRALSGAPVATQVATAGPYVQLIDYCRGNHPMIEQIFETVLTMWAFKGRSPRALRWLIWLHKHVENPVTVRFLSGRSPRDALPDSIGVCETRTVRRPLQASNR